jgi:hypothetical protein
MMKVSEKAQWKRNKALFNFKKQTKGGRRKVRKSNVAAQTGCALKITFTRHFKMYKTIILTVVLHWCKTWSLALKEEHMKCDQNIFGLYLPFKIKTFTTYFMLATSK